MWAGAGLGSDFDGATIPVAIGDARGLPRLVEAAMRKHYDEATVRRICFENWIDVLNGPGAHELGA